MPQQGTLFPAPFLRFAAVLIRLILHLSRSDKCKWKVQGTQFPVRGLGAAPPRKEPMFLADQWQDYEVLDCGGGEKLERWGDVYLRRPDPQAIWPARDPSLWRKAQAHYHRSEKGGGSSENFTKLPDRWVMNYKNLRFYVRPTGFKHTGLFPEQAADCDWMTDLVAERVKQGREVRVLNLFAYTGGATMACAAAGAQVCHCDAAKGMVQWARENRERCRPAGGPRALDHRRRAQICAARGAPRPFLRRHFDGSAVLRTRTRRRGLEAGKRALRPGKSLLRSAF